MLSGLRRAIEECWRPKSQFMLDRATRDQPACRFIPFPSHQFVVSGRSGAVKGAPSTRRSGPLTARIDLQSFGGRKWGFQRARTQAPAKNPEDPQRKRHSLACISHHTTVEARDRTARTSLRLLAVLDVLSSTPARAKRRAPRPDGPLTHFTSPRGEKCRLALQYEDQFSLNTGGRAIRASGGRLTCFAHLRKR